MTAEWPITGIILCGGEAKRFGGEEKPLAQLGDRPMVAHVRAAIASTVAHIIVSANQHLTEYAQYGDAVVADLEPGLGPLGGLYSALVETSTPLAFCCPGDAPFLPDTLIGELTAALHRSGADLAVPEQNGREQHLFILLKTDLRDSLRHFLGRGARTVHQWIATTHHVTVTCHGDAADFLNVNTPADFHEAAAHLASAPEAK